MKYVGAITEQRDRSNSGTSEWTSSKGGPWIAEEFEAEGIWEKSEGTERGLSVYLRHIEIVDPLNT